MMGQGLREVLHREEPPAQPCSVFLSTGGPGEPLPRPGRGLPAADLLDATVPSGLTLQQHGRLSGAHGDCHLSPPLGLGLPVA